MNFGSWAQVIKYNEDAKSPIYCKAQLSKMGLKPKDENTYQIHSVYKGHGKGWGDFKFFTLENAVEKRKVQRVEKTYEPTSENLCQALYVINKSAKKSRDTAQNLYYDGRHGNTKTAKKRKNKIYALKDKVLKKMMDEGVVELVGYNTQTLARTVKVWHSLCDQCEYRRNYDSECDFCDEKYVKWYEEKEEKKESYLLLYKYQSYSFHVPSDKKPDDVEFLCEIDDLISKDVKFKCFIGFSDAMKLLTAYIST